MPRVLVLAACGLIGIACASLDDFAAKSPPDASSSDVSVADEDAGSTSDSSMNVRDDARALSDSAFEAANAPDGAPRCACASPAPANWTGPFELYDGNPGNVPACPGGLTEVLTAFADFGTVPPAECSACACDGPTGLSPGPVTVDAFAQGVACGGPGYKRTSAVTSLGACTPLPYCNSGCGPGPAPYDYQTSNGPPPLGGSCNPSGGSATRPTLLWGRAARGCGVSNPSSQGCTSGQVCAVSPSPPFESKPCILQVGDVACPGTPYTQRRLFYTSADDSRGCTACSCDPPGGVSCTATLDYFASSDCSNGLQATGSAPSGTCISAGMNIYVKAASASCSGGTCPTRGGQPTGTASPKTPVTVCCAP